MSLLTFLSGCGSGSGYVKVPQDIEGTFFMADEVDDIMVLWGKTLEGLVTRYAQCTRKPWGWTLAAISPVEFVLAYG